MSSSPRCGWCDVQCHYKHYQQSDQSNLFHNASFFWGFPPDFFLGLP
jgi:hypothetical protein